MANTKDVSKEELLKLLEEEGIISSDAVQKLIKMDERNKILEQHKYSIKLGPDGRWHTYLPDNTKNNGRRQIAKSAKEKIEDAIVEFYQKLTEKQTMNYKKMFEHWIEVQRSKDLSENTFTRYRSDYARCIAGSDLEKMDITTITEETLLLFLSDVIKRKGLTSQALINLASSMRGVFRSTEINKLIPKTPFKYIDMEVLTKQCIDSTKTDAEMVVSDEEFEKIFKVIDSKLVKNPYCMPLYAILLASLTGMRVGELSALAWNDIRETDILIWQSEKRICSKGKKSIYQIEPFTKTKKWRTFPLTQEISELLTTIKDVQTVMGIDAEYVIQDTKGRVHSTAIVMMANRVSKKAGVSLKSIHAYRKTLSSNLQALNVAPKVVASMLGQSERVNKKCYSYDTTNMDYKQDKLSEVNKKVINLDGYRGTKDVIKSVIKSANM